MGSQPTPGRAALLARRAVLRTEQSPLRPLWALGYRVLARSVARLVARACAGASVYAKGTTAGGRPVYGLSDLDLVVVAPDGSPEAREEARRRWQRRARRLPALRGLVPHLWFYDEAELHDCLRAPCPLFGLEPDGGGPSAAFLGTSPPADEMGLIERPGLERPGAGWKRLAGPDRLPAAAPPGAAERRVVAWLELQEWWRYAFGACADPGRPDCAYLCVKLAAEPARILLWLDGELVHDRLDALDRAARRIPDEEEAFRRAAELHRRLPRSPGAPLAQALAGLVRLSGRLGRRLEAEVEPAGATRVRLVGAEPVLPVEAETRVVPLADWRARAVPRLPDEVLAPRSGDPASPGEVASAIGLSSGWLHPVLRADGLLVLPTRHPWAWGRLRAVQCPPSDPVSFAVLDGRATAAFPEVPGWSALDCARRAVAEHRAWLEAPLAGAARPPEWIRAPRSSSEATAGALGHLFTAARAALFARSVEEGEPALALTAGATAALLGTDVASEALDAYRACRPEKRDPDARLARAFREHVASLAPYRRAAG